MKKRKSPSLSSPPLDRDRSQGIDVSASKLALDVCMAEYKRMVDEILTGLEWHKSLIQYALAIVAGAATVIGLFPSFYEIFLIASILLSVIAWIFAEQSIKMLTFGQYIMHVLQPKVNALISSIASREGSIDPNLSDLLSFDSFFRMGDFRSFVSGFFSGGKFLIALFPGLGFVLAYLYIIPQKFGSWAFQQKIFFLFALVLAIVPIIFGILASPYYFIRYRRKDR